MKTKKYNYKEKPYLHSITKFYFYDKNGKLYTKAPGIQNNKLQLETDETIDNFIETTYMENIAAKSMINKQPAVQEENSTIQEENSDLNKSLKAHAKTIKVKLKMKVTKKKKRLFKIKPLVNIKETVSEKKESKA